jgi:hypothetical protein
MEDQRQSTRRLIRQLLQVTDRDEAAVGNLVNLSHDGFMLVMPDPVAPGAVLDLVLELPYEVAGVGSIKLAAECIWCQKSSFSDDYGAGFRIEKMAPEDQRTMWSIFGGA